MTRRRLTEYMAGAPRTLAKEARFGRATISGWWRDLARAPRVPGTRSAAI
jgi:hypothetical protein